MFKVIISALSLFFLNFSLLFGALQRGDYLDNTSKGAQIKLQRAEKILETLVPDPQSYHLLLSSRYTLGAEAHLPHFFSEKPTIIVYQGLISPDRSDEEVAFVLAHELGHLNLHHMERMGKQMEKIHTGQPLEVSGKIFSIFYIKIQEREADLYGFNLYKKAGYDLNFFPYTLKLININPNIHFGSNRIFEKELPTLSMKNSHFNIKERFELLAQKAQS